MFTLRQIIDDPQEFIPVPPELRHRRTEVIFIELDEQAPRSPRKEGPPISRLAALAGCWEGDLERPPQGEHETRREWE